MLTLCWPCCCGQYCPTLGSRIVASCRSLCGLLSSYHSEQLVRRTVHTFNCLNICCYNYIFTRVYVRKSRLTFNGNLSISLPTIGEEISYLLGYIYPTRNQPTALHLMLIFSSSDNWGENQLLLGYNLSHAKPAHRPARVTNLFPLRQLRGKCICTAKNKKFL